MFEKAGEFVPILKDAKMKGLKTQESDRFRKYLAIVESEAEKLDSIFFLDAGDGNDFKTETMEGEELMGWLIPNDKVAEFESLWLNDKVDDSWTDFFGWAIWELTEGAVRVHFEL